MQGKINLTLYEVFGYFLPGTIMLAAAWVCAWAAYFPDHRLQLPGAEPAGSTWVAIVLTAYFLGHAAQAIANLFFKDVEESILGADEKRPEWLRQKAKTLAANLIGIDPTKLNWRWVYKTLDECRIQAQVQGDSEVYLYREGFYRGVAIGLGFLSLSVAFRVMRQPLVCLIGGAVVAVPRWSGFAAVTLLVIAAWICVRRYRRFAAYRVDRTIMAAILSVPSKSGASRPSEACKEEVEVQEE